MKAIKLAAGMILVLSSIISPVDLLNSTDLTHVEAYQAAIKPSTTGMIRELQPNGDAFRIAETGDIDPSTAVAYGGGYHVIVYTKRNTRNHNENIFATVVPGKETGDINGYPISSLDSDYGHPAIAYHARSGLFIILYSHLQTEIYAQVFSPASETIGPAFLISDDEVHKGLPAIACNQLDGVCLAVYQQNGTQIKGRYLEASNGEIINLSAIYDLTSGLEVDQPRLAWGRGQGTFLLAYDERLASGEVRPAYTHLYDQHDPLAAEVLLHPSMPVIPGGVFSDGHDAFISDIAFDPCTEQFVLMIEYDAAGDGGNLDLWAAVLHAREPILNGTFPIADSPVSEQGGAIRFITADQETYVCGNQGRLVVAYINADVGLMATELRGNSNPKKPSYAVDPAHQHLLIANHTNMFRITNCILSSSGKGNQVLIAYDFLGIESSEFIIMGQFLSIIRSVYLPLVMR